MTSFTHTQQWEHFIALRCFSEFQNPEHGEANKNMWQARSCKTGHSGSVSHLDSIPGCATDSLCDLGEVTQSLSLSYPSVKWELHSTSLIHACKHIKTFECWSSLERPKVLLLLITSLHFCPKSSQAVPNTVCAILQAKVKCKYNHWHPQLHPSPCPCLATAVIVLLLLISSLNGQQSLLPGWHVPSLRLSVHYRVRSTHVALYQPRCACVYT